MNPRIALPLLALALSLGTASTAGATDFCVPDYHPACPDNGTNVAEADLETAMEASPNDGQADSIRIAPGTLTDPDVFNVGIGPDPLEIIGSGRNQTVLTSSNAGTQWVLNLVSPRPIVVRDLTVEAPDSFDDDAGAAVRALGAELEHVDVVSRNSRSDGVLFQGPGRFLDGAVRGVDGGSIRDAFVVAGAGDGTAKIEEASIIEPKRGIVGYEQDLGFRVSRSRIIDPEQHGVLVSDGAEATIDNTVIHSTGLALVAYSGTPGAGATGLTARNVTLVSDSPIGNAVQAIADDDPGSRSVQVSVTDSIIRGFFQSYYREAPVGANTGNANLSILSSNIESGYSDGDGSLNLADNIEADPLFAGPGDFRLLPGSPSIDAGDPEGVVPPVDIDGAERPVDGDGDGEAIRDQGAYEAPVLPADDAPAGPTPAPPTQGESNAAGAAGDRSRPLISLLRFLRRPSGRRGARVALTLSEPATLELAFTPIRRGARRSARARTVRLRFSGKAGRNVLRIKPRKLLRSRRYKLTLVATDAAGNRSLPLRRRVKVAR